MDYEHDLRSLMIDFSLSQADLNKLFKELRCNAKSLLLKRLSKSTDLDDLKRQLEGAYVTLQTLHVKIATESGFISGIYPMLSQIIQIVASFAAVCKARTRLRGLQTKVKLKADKIIDLINEKCSKVLVTAEHLKTGKFPWYEEEGKNSKFTSKNSLFPFFLKVVGDNIILHFVWFKCSDKTNFALSTLGCCILEA